MISYKIPLLLITFLLAGPAGCSKKDSIEKNRGNLNPILTFGNDGEAILSNPVVLATDRQEHLFVSDQLVSKIYHYGINGDFVKTIGGEGRGPGEFTYQREIDVYNDRLFVQDMGLLRFHIFDFNGEVIDLRADASAKYSSFTVNDSLIIGHIPDHPLKQEGLEQDSLIIIHDYDGNTIGEFGSYMNVAEGIPAIMSWPAIKIYKDQVHVAFKYFPIYQIYDLHGTLISETNLNQISGIEDPEGNHNNSSYTDISRSDANISAVINTIDIWEDMIYVLRQDRALVIDKFRFIENSRLEYEETYSYSHPTDEYFGIDFFYYPDSNAFYVLENQEGIPQLRVYEIGEEELAEVRESK